MSAISLIFILALFLPMIMSQIYNRDFYLKQYLDNSPMYASGPAQGFGGGSYYQPTSNYYPQSFHHPSAYYQPRDMGIYGGYPYPSQRLYEPSYGGGQGYGAPSGYGRIPYGYNSGYYGNDYGYASDQPGMFRGALDGAIKGTLAGAFGL